MQQVFVADSPAQAHLVAGLLEDAGIEAVVEGELLTGIQFGVATDSSTRPTVFVRPEDFSRARTLILEHGPGAAREAPAPQAAESPDEAAPVQRPALKWFKRGLLLWFVILPVASGVVALAVVAPMAAAAVVFGVLAVVYWPRAPKRGGPPGS